MTAPSKNAPSGSAQTLKIGTRKSPLAMWQAEFVRDELQKVHSGLKVELCPIETRGDKILDVALSKVGGKGLFVKELEVALLDGRVDLCVHSTKDMPAELPEGLGLVAFPPRADPRDALVMGGKGGLAALPYGARVGTSSLRRQAQILAVRPDIEVVSVRGNIQTRMKKVAELNLSCVVLACAGIDRMGDGMQIGHRFAPSEMLPAAAQGILSIEARLNDDRVLPLVMVLDDAATRRAALAERAFLKMLGGGCQVPIGAYCEENGDQMTLRGMVGRPDGRALVQGALVGPAADPVALGEALGRELLDTGGRRVLIEVGIDVGPSGTQALQGHTVIVTRDEAPDDNISQTLLAAGATVLALPLMQLDAPEDGSALEAAVRDLAGADVLAFTSVAAVERFFDRLANAGFDLRGLPASALIAAVGARTRAALLERGAHIDVVGDKGGAALAKAIAASCDLNGKTVLFPRAQDGRDELVDALQEAGATVKVVDAYRSVPSEDVQQRVQETLAKAGARATLLFTSPRRVEVFATALGAQPLKNVRLIALGKTTAQAISDAGIGDAEVPKKPTSTAIVEVLKAQSRF